MKARDFINIYLSYLPKEKTYKQAYEQAEEEHKQLNGKRFYKNYASFKATLSRLRKKK